jgi:hypothetical protein
LRPAPHPAPGDTNLPITPCSRGRRSSTRRQSVESILTTAISTCLMAATGGSPCRWIPTSTTSTNTVGWVTTDVSILGAHVGPDRRVWPALRYYRSMPAHP